MATFDFNTELTYAEIVKMFDNKGMLIPTAEVLERVNAIIQDLSPGACKRHHTGPSDDRGERENQASHVAA
jgi:hypothetical protein